MTEQKKKEVGRREERKEGRKEERKEGRKEGRKKEGGSMFWVMLPKDAKAKFSVVLIHLPVLREIRHGHSVLVPLLE